MAGNPNPKGSKPDKLMRDALMIGLKREAANSEGKLTPKLMLMADALIDKAVGGDVQAIREIADRIDGKAPQAIEQTTEVTHLYVARVPTISKTGDEWQRDHASKLDGQTLQ